MYQKAQAGVRGRSALRDGTACWSAICSSFFHFSTAAYFYLWLAMLAGSAWIQIRLKEAGAVPRRAWPLYPVAVATGLVFATYAIRLVVAEAALRTVRRAARPSGAKSNKRRNLNQTYPPANPTEPEPTSTIPAHCVFGGPCHAADFRFPRLEPSRGSREAAASSAKTALTPATVLVGSIAAAERFCLSRRNPA